ncbi:MAG: low molecular weight protein arginine phosphatase [Clostridia bacterium]|nr:low molecular weight protein arginine phosphatase [Clostridia bacterium]
MKLVFVCSGNTCRSPMAECVLEYLLKKEGIEGIEVSSRGVVANVGADTSENAKKALEAKGIPVKKHVATQMTTQEVFQNDLVICMTERHKMRLGSLPKVFTLHQLTSCGDIVDPFGGDEEVYKKCLDELIAAITKLIPILKRQLALETPETKAQEKPHAKPTKKKTSEGKKKAPEEKKEKNEA